MGTRIWTSVRCLLDLVGPDSLTCGAWTVVACRCIEALVDAGMGLLPGVSRGRLATEHGGSRGAAG